MLPALAKLNTGVIQNETMEPQHIAGLINTGVIQKETKQFGDPRKTNPRNRLVVRCVTHNAKV